MSCSFCIEFHGINDEPAGSRIIWEDDSFLLLPTRGCFVQGYCLFMPRAHYRSLASLPTAADELCEGLAQLEAQRARIRERFGTVILAEHGIGIAGDLGAGCCDHAHVHMIPLPSMQEPLLGAYVEIGGDPIQLERPLDLAEYRETSYLSLSLVPGQWLVWPDARPFSSQFVRRQAARLLGMPEHFDWRRHPFAENMDLTRRALLPALPPLASDR